MKTNVSLNFIFIFAEGMCMGYFKQASMLVSILSSLWSSIINSEHSSRNIKENIIKTAIKDTTEKCLKMYKYCSSLYFRENKSANTSFFKVQTIYQGYFREESRNYFCNSQNQSPSNSAQYQQQTNLTYSFFKYIFFF